MRMLMNEPVGCRSNHRHVSRNKHLDARVFKRKAVAYTVDNPPRPLIKSSLRRPLAAEKLLFAVGDLSPVYATHAFEYPGF